MLAQLLGLGSLGAVKAAAPFASLLGAQEGVEQPPETMGEPIKVQPAPQHKGMFGIKGTARDILGTLGDAFLVQAGRDPIYGPRREQEKIMDAMAGYDPMDEQSSMAAISRLSQINPKLANEMAVDFMDTRAKVAANQALATQRGVSSGRDVADMATALLNTATPENYPRIRAMIQQMEARSGVQLPFTLPETYTEDVRNLAYASYPVKDQVSEARRQKYGETRLEQLERNLESQIDARRASTAQGAARVSQGERRTREYERRGREGMPGKSGSSGGGGGAVPPRAPTRKGDTMTGRTASGQTVRFVSPDGKTWKKAN